MHAHASLTEVELLFPAENNVQVNNKAHFIYLFIHARCVKFRRLGN